MLKIKFSLKNYRTQHDAYVAWELAQYLLIQHQIPHTIDVIEQEVFVITQFTGQMKFSKVFSITFKNESDLTAYQLIKD